jgi:hypothetical protein
LPRLTRFSTAAPQDNGTTTAAASSKPAN